MTPYVDFSYFLFLLYPLALIVGLGVLGRLGRPAILLVSVAMLAFQFLNPLGEPAAIVEGWRQFAFLVAYVGISLVAVLGFAWVRRRRRSQAAFYAAVGVALLPLVAVKLYPLAVTHGWLVGPLAGLASASDAGALSGAPSVGLFDAFGFLGISYMTFRVIDAIVVVHDGLVKDLTHPAPLASYLLFAPTISAGPIDRYRRFATDLATLPRGGWAYLAEVEAGVHRIAQGFLYKFILAYLIYRYALQPAATVPGIVGNLRYMYAYSLYLFFDFAGYSAFAIGVGRFFGIHVPENFNAPFLSRDFREMWNRWHISLSWWLRDHVYMRFVLNATRRKWLRGNRHSINYAGLILTMTLMGMWHGLYLHYLVYGVYQGVMLVGYDLVGRWNRRRKLIQESWLSQVASIVLTVNLFCFGLLIFSGHLFQ